MYWATWIVDLPTSFCSKICKRYHISVQKKKKIVVHCTSTWHLKLVWEVSIFVSIQDRVTWNTPSEPLSGWIYEEFLIGLISTSFTTNEQSILIFYSTIYRVQDYIKWLSLLISLASSLSKISVFCCLTWTNIYLFNYLLTILLHFLFPNFQVWGDVKRSNNNKYRRIWLWILFQFDSTTTTSTTTTKLIWLWIISIGYFKIKDNINTFNMSSYITMEKF